MPYDRRGNKNPNYQAVWPRRRPMLEEFCRMGLSLSEMARRFHCNKRHVRLAISQFGIEYKLFVGAGVNNPAWRGGVVIEKKGYVKVYAPNHPHKDRHNKVWQHRIVMEAKLGRILDRSERVHHIDGNPLNNRPDNLQLFRSNGEHLAETLAGKCPQWGIDGKHRISDAVRRRHLRDKAMQVVPNRTPQGTYAPSSRQSSGHSEASAATGPQNP